MHSVTASARLRAHEHRPRAAGRHALEYDRAFFGHPRGLSTLFFTEMWERFSYYGMRALLILFMTAAASRPAASASTPARRAPIYGLYTSMVYMTSLPGGWIADRLIGQRRAVLYGGILIACGHFSMAVPSLTTFYLGLALIVLGTGLLKGNVSVIVGQLYRPDDQRRDAGFSIFYMGINLGAFHRAARLRLPRASASTGTSASPSAGVGMVLGLVQYVAAAQVSRRRRRASRRPRLTGRTRAPEASARALGRRLSARRSCSSRLAALTGVVPVTAKQIADAAGYGLLALTVGFFAWLFLSGGWTRAERNRLFAIGVLFLAVRAVLVRVRAGRLDAEPVRRSHHAQLGRSAGTFRAAGSSRCNPLFIIAFAPVFAWLWVRLGQQGASRRAPRSSRVGLLLRRRRLRRPGPRRDHRGRTASSVSPWWLTVTYLLHTFGELCAEPGRPERDDQARAGPRSPA